MNLAQSFADSARRNLKKTALFWGDAEFSYGELWARSRWVAERLTRDFGVKPGDRVGIWLKNCPEFIPALFGILPGGRRGRSHQQFPQTQRSPIHPRRRRHRHAHHRWRHAGRAWPRSTADPPATERSFSPRQSPPRHCSANRPIRNPSNPQSAIRNPQSDLAVIIYTSGTTGHPKGAMLSHANLLANLESCRIALEAVGEDRFVVLLPMFHSFMLTVGILLPLYIGGSIVLVKSLHPAKNIVQEIIRHQATILPAVPQFFRALARAALPGDLPLRICISGARAVAGGDFEGIHRALPLSAPGRLRLERGQPGGFLQSHSRPVEGRFHRRADFRRGSLRRKTTPATFSVRARPGKSACAAQTSCSVIGISRRKPPRFSAAAGF